MDCNIFCWVCEKGWAQIGGIEQGYFIRGEDEKNPVILFLHGGPGNPEIQMNKDVELEKYFTICYWDQRGAGMSYSAGIDTVTMTIEQFVEDTRQITDSLCKWYNVEKIYLMGHSWGSYLGIKTIEKYPERYYAFIGIGQVCNQLESERMAYDYVVDQAYKVGDVKTVKAFKAYDKNADDFPSNDYLFKVRAPLLNKYGVGVMRKGFSFFNMATDLLFYKGYTFMDKIHYMQGIMFSHNNMFDCVIKDNLFESSTKFDIPIYILQGKYDYQVSYKLAKDYFDSIDAPIKRFFTFEESAHSPNFEEPELFTKVIRSVILNTN